jgi:hypothetical protein
MCGRPSLPPIPRATRDRPPRRGGRRHRCRRSWARAPGIARGNGMRRATLMTRGRASPNTGRSHDMQAQHQFAFFADASRCPASGGHPIYRRPSRKSLRPLELGPEREYSVVCFFFCCTQGYSFWPPAPSPDMQDNLHRQAIGDCDRRLPDNWQICAVPASLEGSLLTCCVLA